MKKPLEVVNGNDAGSGVSGQGTLNAYRLWVGLINKHFEHLNFVVDNSLFYIFVLNVRKNSFYTNMIFK